MYIYIYIREHFTLYIYIYKVKCRQYETNLGPKFYSACNRIWSSSTDFRKRASYLISSKSVQWDRQTHMTRLIGIFFATKQIQ